MENASLFYNVKQLNIFFFLNCCKTVVENMQIVLKSREQNWSNTRIKFKFSENKKIILWLFFQKYSFRMIKLHTQSNSSQMSLTMSVWGKVYVQAGEQPSI